MGEEAEPDYPMNRCGKAMVGGTGPVSQVHRWVTL